MVLGFKIFLFMRLFKSFEYGYWKFWGVLIFVVKSLHKDWGLLRNEYTLKLYGEPVGLKPKPCLSLQSVEHDLQT